MIKTENLFIKAAFQKPVDRVPIWLMRQAGRYMKEYQVLRRKYSFLELCKIPEKVTEVTLLPIRLLEVDAAILFSDILLVSEAMGMNLSFTDKGPHFSSYIRTKNDIDKLKNFESEESFSFCMKAIKYLKEELNNKIPLIGFSGAPFTIMSYMIEGGVNRNLKITKLWLHKNKKLAHKLLNKITENLINYLNSQIHWGVQAIQIFDTWACYLSSYDFREFSLNYLKKLILKLKKNRIPIIVFAKGSGAFYIDWLEANPDVMSFDWNVNLAQVKRNLGDKVAVQGNFDPYLLYADSTIIKNESKKLLASMKNTNGYIFNLGHGLLPDIPFDHVKCLVNTVREFG